MKWRDSDVQTLLSREIQQPVDCKCNRQRYKAASRSSSFLPPLRNSLHHAFALLAVSGNGRTIRPWTSGFGIHAQTTAREDLPEEALVGSLISVLVSLDPGISSVSDYMYDSRSACNHDL